MSHNLLQRQNNLTNHFFPWEGQVEELIWHVHFQHKSCRRYWVSNIPSSQCKFPLAMDLNEKNTFVCIYVIVLPFESSSTNSQHLWTIFAMDIFISDRLLKFSGKSRGMMIIIYLCKGCNIFIQILPCFFVETNFDNCNQDATEWHGIVIHAAILF